MSQLRGADELRRRIKAMHLSFKDVGRKWGDRTVERFRPAVPVRTGRLRASFRVKNSTQRRTTVAGHFTAFFIDKGTVPHVITPHKHGRLVFNVGGHTVFARQVHHRGQRAQPFRGREAHRALADTDITGVLVDAWNKAA